MCSLLAAPGIYDDAGVNAEHVEEVKVAMQNQCKSILEQGLAENLQRVLRSLMRNTGMSEEQARKALGMSASSGKRSGTL